MGGGNHIKKNFINKYAILPHNYSLSSTTKEQNNKNLN